MKKSGVKFYLYLALLITPFHLFANTYVNKTRVIVTEKSQEESFIIHNEGISPVLIQSWIDDGNEYTQPEKIDVPFILLPPIFRVEANSSFNVRVLTIKNKLKDLPKDRESLFWLNVLEIPPKGINKDNSFQVAFRTRLKLFYRPKNIENEDINSAIGRIKYSIVRGNVKNLLIQNPSPFFLTLMSVSDKNGLISDKLPNQGIIEPFGEMLVTVKQQEEPNVKDVILQYVDDYGVIAKTH